MLKKTFSLLAIIFAIVNLHSQTINADSLLQTIVNKDIINKVERHEKLVEQIEWTSPGLLGVTIFSVLAIGYIIFLHVKGLHNKAMEIIKSDSFNKKIDEIISQRVIALAHAKEEKIKAKPVRIIYLPNKDMRRLPKFLSDCGYTNVLPFSTEESFEITPNMLIIFNDEDGDFTDKIKAYILSNPGIKSKGHFFYFGSKRFIDTEIRMRNFANSDDTLAARLFESLSAT